MVQPIVDEASQQSEAWLLSLQPTRPLLLTPHIHLPSASGPVRLPIRVTLVLLPPGSNPLGELLKDLHRRIPIDASVRDADTLLQRSGAFGWDFLIALVDVGFDHDADNGRLAFAELVADRLRHVRLVAVVFVGVAFGLFR